MNPWQRALIIGEWRGLPEFPSKPERQTTAADAVGRLMESLGLAQRLRQEEALAAWRELVGDFIAAHATPQTLELGVLTIRVLQPTMHYELDRVWKAKILRKFQERFGQKLIREVRFRIG